MPAALLLALALAPQPEPERPIEPAPLPAVRVRIENPLGYQLWIDAVGEEGCETLCELVGTPVVEPLLRRGHAYVLVATSGAGKESFSLRLPLPLPARAELPDPYVLRVPAPRESSDDFAWIPAGPALLGDELGIGREHERPARVAPVGEFWMGRREVTNSEYAAFLNARRDAIDPDWLDLGSRKCRIVQNRETGGYVTRHPDQPVVTVSWAGAVAYCDWLTEVSGVVHRLPNEFEWEKAARGPESFVYGYGNVFTQGLANQESGELQDAGRHAPNGYGLLDVTGNAFEWTRDVYVFDPTIDREQVGQFHADGAEAYRVLRGGSFVLDGVYLRNSFRMRLRPDVRTDDIGFRVLREAAPGSRKEQR